MTKEFAYVPLTFRLKFHIRIAISLGKGIHVVFGTVTQGFEIVRLIENLQTDEKSRPLTNVSISHSGELIIKIKSKPK